VKRRKPARRKSKPSGAPSWDEDEWTRPAQSWGEWTRDPYATLIRDARFASRLVRRQERKARTAKPANPKRGRKRRPVRGGRVRRAVQGVVCKLYPPDGKVPDSVSTETVRQDVIKEIQRTEPNYTVSWHTVNRVLGRE